MSEPQEAIQDLMNRYGFEEKEALAAYHLRKARQIFEELYAPGDDPGVGLVRTIYNQMLWGSHFRALTRMLGTRVLMRDYPDGWARPPASEEETDSG
jgi:hypothetical protein